MICLLCGAKVPFFRRLSDPEYCSDAHRKEHERDMAEQALARLTRKPTPAKFAERPKAPEVELRPLVIPPLSGLAEEMQREPGEFGSRSAGFLAVQSHAQSQLWDFLSTTDDIAWTVALHIPTHFNAGTFTGLRIAGSANLLGARRYKRPLARRDAAEPRWPALPWRYGAAASRVTAAKPGLGEAKWKVEAEAVAPANAGLRWVDGPPRFGALPIVLGKAGSWSGSQTALAPRENAFVVEGARPASTPGVARAGEGDGLRLALARVERVRFNGVISLPHTLPEAGFAEMVRPMSAPAMRPSDAAPGFRASLSFSTSRSEAVQPVLPQAVFSGVRPATAPAPAAAARQEAGGGILVAGLRPVLAYARAGVSVADERRIALAARVQTAAPEPASVAGGAPLNGAMPLPFGWPLAHPQALLATAAPAMAMVGALRRERPQAVYAPARLRRSGSVPRPFRAAMRLGEFHVRVLEPGHPSEKRAVEYTPAALPETGPRKRRRPVEAEVPVEAGAAAAASGAAAPDRTENELRRKLVEAAAAEPLTTRILDRLRELWEDAPRLARAGVLAIPALVAALLYFQGSETNVAAGGGVAETTRPTAAPPPTPVETAPAAAKATPAAAPVAAAPEAPGTAPLPSDVPPSVADKPPGGFSLASLQYAIRRRATVYVDEDFRSGLLRWSGEEGWDKTWAIDRTYLATPGKLALLEPTLKLENYRFEFLGQVGKKSLSFVFRAKDEDNYHAGRINLIAPRGAPNGRISLTRWMVIDGEEQNKKEIPLPGTVELDAMYRVLVTIQGGHFTLHVNGQMADYWDDDRLAWGGIGFFNEKGAVSKLLWAKVIDNDDFLGNVCSLLSPKTADRKTLNRDRSGKDSASR